MTGPGRYAKPTKDFHLPTRDARRRRAVCPEDLSALVEPGVSASRSSADLDYLMRQYRQGGLQKGDFEAGVRLALQTMLSDPEFVFRSSVCPPG